MCTSKARYLYQNFKNSQSNHSKDCITGVCVILFYSLWQHVSATQPSLGQRIKYTLKLTKPKYNHANIHLMLKIFI
jgi:hypothetical protein